MRRRGSLLALLAVVTLLTACTGTQEDPVPTLLIVGSAQGSLGQLQLLEHSFDPSASPPRQVVAVPGATFGLSAPPLSFDVADRTGARSELVVLTGSGAGATLHFIDTGDIDTARAQPLVRSREALDLAAVLAEADAPVDFACLAQVQVSTGTNGRARYAAVLDDGSCGDGQAAIHIVDTVSREYLDSVDMPTLLGGEIYVDQGNGRLYFGEEFFGDVAVRSLELPAGEPSEEMAVTNITVGERHALAPLSAGVGVVVNGRLAVVPYLLDEDADVNAIDTVSGGGNLVPDHSALLDEILVYSTTRVAVHENFEDDDPHTRSVPLAMTPLLDSTLQPFDRFAYLLGEDSVVVVDLVRRESQSNPYDLVGYELDELAGARVITWVYTNTAEEPER